MAKGGGSDEGSILAVGVVLIIICMGGGQAAGVSPLRFFFLGGSLLFFGALIGIVVISFGISVVNVWVEAHKQDGRALWQIIKDEYSAKRMVKNYRTVIDHAKDHARSHWESENAAGLRKLAEKGRGRAKIVTGHVNDFTSGAKQMWELYKRAGKDDL